MSFQDDHNIYTKLREVISYSEIPSGVYLNVYSLAKEYGVSIIPIREALIRLSADDIVDFYNRKGFFTKSITYKQLIDDYHIFFHLLSHAIGTHPPQVTECITKQDIRLDKVTKYKFIKNVSEMKAFEKSIKLHLNSIMTPTIRYIAFNALARTRPFRMIAYRDPSRFDNVKKHILSIFEYSTSGRSLEATEQCQSALKNQLSTLPQDFIHYVEQDKNF